jgi:1-acyl-sn-glycerol-3-phosphate acyltransferase
MGGAILATYSKYPVYPVAHNAGKCWPRNSFIKRPGKVTVSIDPKIESDNKSINELNNEVRTWIEEELKTLPSVR